MKTLSNLFLKFPEGRIKNMIRSVLYSAKPKRFFTIHYQIKKDIWQIEAEGIKLLFKKNPYHIFSTNPLFLKHLPSWDPEIIVDAGAFHGTVGLYLAKKFPKAKVFLLEPDKRNFLILSQNIQLNGLDNITAMEKGLWNSNTTLYFGQGNELSSSIIRDKNIQDINSSSIQVITLQTLLGKTERKKVFIKMNIEGAELEVFPDCVELWKNNVLRMSVASDHKIDGKYTYEKIEEYCKKHSLQFKTEHINIYKTTYILESGN